MFCYAGRWRRNAVTKDQLFSNGRVAQKLILMSWLYSAVTPQRTQKHFYAIIANNEQYRKYDGLRNPLTEPWDYDTFVGSINIVFYLCLSLPNSYRFTTWCLPPFKRAHRQATSNFVGNSARCYSGNAIPIMANPDIWNATCNGISSAANN